jgi:hypothetical protein
MNLLVSFLPLLFFLTSALQQRCNCAVTTKAIQLKKCSDNKNHNYNFSCIVSFTYSRACKSLPNIIIKCANSSDLHQQYNQVGQVLTDHAYMKASQQSSCMH